MRRREWREIATDTAYRQIHGSPLYGPHGLDESAVDAWFVLGGRFVFLVRADRVEGTSVEMGTVTGRPADLSERATGLGLPLGRPS